MKTKRRDRGHPTPHPKKARTTVADPTPVIYCQAPAVGPSCRCGGPMRLVVDVNCHPRRFFYQCVRQAVPAGMLEMVRADDFRDLLDADADSLTAPPTG